MTQQNGDHNKTIMDNNTSISIQVSDTFDGGNIKYMGQKPNVNDPDNILDVFVRIRPDVYTELENMIHMQYFCFRVVINGLVKENTNGNNNGAGKKTKQRIKYVIENAHAVSFPDAWTGTTIFYSYDIEDVDSWKRNIDTYYTDGKLWWEHEHIMNGCIYFSYFPPYSYSRHLQLISKCMLSNSINNSNNNDDVVVMSLGQTIQGRDIDCIQIGTGSLIAWIIHRQHPGETMAEHYAEGLLYRLLQLDGENNNNKDNNDMIRRLKELYTFYIVPCMCPDGAVLGHLRTNSVGANLNREWSSKPLYDAPTIERSPEVYYVIEKMKDTGVDFFLDVHGDEELPYNFCMCPENNINWNSRLQSLHSIFIKKYCIYSNHDMQDIYGYPPLDNTARVMEYLNVALYYIVTTYNCLAITLEMPFKDCRNQSDPIYGWSPKRCRALGANVLNVLEEVAPYLRSDTEWWKDMKPDDIAFRSLSNKYLDDDDNDDDDGHQFKMLHTRYLSDVHEDRKPKLKQQQQQQSSLTTIIDEHQSS